MHKLEQRTKNKSIRVVVDGSVVSSFCKHILIKHRTRWKRRQRTTTVSTATAAAAASATMPPQQTACFSFAPLYLCCCFHFIQSNEKLFCVAPLSFSLSHIQYSHRYTLNEIQMQILVLVHIHIYKFNIR